MKTIATFPTLIGNFVIKLDQKMDCYAVIREDGDLAKIKVKHYTRESEYQNDLKNMFSVFECEKKANVEAKRLQKHFS